MILKVVSIRHKLWHDVNGLYYRIFSIGQSVLWGVGIGIIPAFGIPARIGDVLIGLTAIPFAFFLKKGYIVGQRVQQ
jgi:hypothetical protein